MLKELPEPTIVVVMALHGGVDAEGPYLLPQDAKAVPESRDRLRMTDVLRVFSGLPRYKKKILILDATGLPYHWELGMLRNDFARELKKLDAEIKKIHNFVVVCASGEGQRSWVNESAGRTAFLHFLIRALSGTATRASVGSAWPPSKRVNLEEVFDDVAREVNSWAAIHCNAAQEPFILPSGDDGRRLARSIELPPVRPLVDPEAPVEDERRSIEQALASRWGAFRDLATSPVPIGVADPIGWRHYQKLLRRYDELLRIVGTRGEAEYGEVLAELKAKRLQIAESRTTPLTKARAATLTVALAEGVTHAVSPADGTTPTPGRPLDPAAPDKEVQTWFDKEWWPAAEDQEQIIWKTRKNQERDGDARDLAAQLGDLLLGRAIDNPSGNLDHAARLAKRLDLPSQRPAELNLLIMLQRALNEWKSPGDPELIRMALRVRRLAERAALGLPEQAAAPDKVVAGTLVAPWVRDKVDEGDRHRRQAEDLLFASDRREQARVAYAGAERVYRDAIEAAETVRRAVLEARTSPVRPRPDHRVARHLVSSARPGQPDGGVRRAHRGSLGEGPRREPDPGDTQSLQDRPKFDRPERTRCRRRYRFEGGHSGTRPVKDANR